MDIFSRFKKDYANYFLSIIVPSLINGLSVPVLKHLLGAAGYGQYALCFNAMLIANVLISGWLSQSVLRFNARAADKQEFATQSFFIAAILPVMLFVPVLIVVGVQYGSGWFGLLFAATLLLASLQLPLQTLTQANFHSKTTLFAEAMRTITWFAIAMLLYWVGVPYLYSLFGALFISYLVSVVYLYRSNPLPPFGRRMWMPPGWRLLVKQFSGYGIPVSMWFVFSYLLTYVDKLYMRQFFGGSVQGNYNALFDLLSKGLVLLLAPVLTSAFPLLSEAYEKGEKKVVNNLLARLIGYELIALLLGVAAYYAFGYRILIYILGIPQEAVYLHTGALIIVGTLTWQVAMLAHKPYELQLRSRFMLWRIAIAFACQMVFYFFTNRLHHPLVYPAGYCLAAMVYLLLIALPGVWQNRMISKNKVTAFSLGKESVG